MRSRKTHLLSMTAFLTLFLLSGCVDSAAPAPDTDRIEARPSGPVGTTADVEEAAAPYVVEWSGRLDAEACVVVRELDTCGGLPLLRERAADNPNSRHFVRYEVSPEAGSRSMSVAVDWTEDETPDPEGWSNGSGPLASTFDFRVSCATMEREPCVGGRYTIAYAAGDTPTLLLEDIDLSWFDPAAHDLTWTFAVQAKQEAGAYFFPETHVRYGVVGTFEGDA